MSWELDGVPIPREIAILRKMYCLYVKAILSEQEHVQSQQERYEKYDIGVILLLKSLLWTCSPNL